MSDMSATIVPKSDQLNYDDLISAPRTIKITKVVVSPSGDQPVSVYYEGDNGKPYKPCKGMRRVMVIVWGNDSKAYTGRSMTLFGNPAVVYAGFACGGIQISHMDGLTEPITIALTEKKGKRAPFTVKPLVVQPEAPTDHKLTKEQQQAIITELNSAHIDPQEFKAAFGVKASLGELKTSQLLDISAWIDGQKVGAAN